MATLTLDPTWSHRLLVRSLFKAQVRRLTAFTLRAERKETRMMLALKNLQNEQQKENTFKREKSWPYLHYIDDLIIGKSYKI